MELFLLTYFEGGEDCTIGVFESMDKVKQYIQQTRAITKIEEKTNMWGWKCYINVEEKEGDYTTPFYGLSKTTLNMGV